MTIYRYRDVQIFRNESFVLVKISDLFLLVLKLWCKSYYIKIVRWITMRKTRKLQRRTKGETKYYN